jgi:hypothetical protein
MNYSAAILLGGRGSQVSFFCVGYPRLIKKLKEFEIAWLAVSPLACKTFVRFRNYRIVRNAEMQDFTAVLNFGEAQYGILLHHRIFLSWN